jgi:uncharacterized protein YoxC
MDIKQFALWAVVVLCSVPILIQIARMIGSLIELIKAASVSLKELSGELTTTLKTTNRILSTVDEMIVGVKDLVSSLKEFGAGVRKLGETLKESSQYVTKLFGQITGLIAVIKSTFGILARGVIKKGGRDDKET